MYNIENIKDGISLAGLTKVSKKDRTYTRKLVDKIIDNIKKAVSDFDVILVDNYNPVKFEKDCKLVKTLVYTYEKVTGNDGTPVTTTGGTYAKLMPNIVPFGPSFPGQKGIGHLPNEWMTIEDIITNAKIYALSLYHLAK